MVEGMLIDYVENAKSVRMMETFSREECESWSNQIHDAIKYIHQNGLVWGDAKADNVLIRENGSVVLVAGIPRGGSTRTNTRRKKEIGTGMRELWHSWPKD